MINTNSKRLDRLAYFMEIAKLTAKRGTCPRAQVGAVAVKDNRIIMSAYNGSVSGGKHCTEIGCLLIDGHCMRTVHAEMNIITGCAKEGISLKGSIVYCTFKPCCNCLMALISSGVQTVYYETEKKDSRTPEELYHLIELRQLYDYNDDLLSKRIFE